MPRYKIKNGIRIQLTPEEEIARDVEETTANNNSLNRALSFLRHKRNILLAETDYLALSDHTLSDDMNTYRQELRDITNGLTTVEEVNAVVFPEKPEV